MTTIRAVRSWPDTVPAENRTLGWGVLAWASKYLLQPDGPEAGEPWKFTREQVRIVLRWYQVDERGRFAYRRGVLRRMKGWGKDPFLAAIAAIELCGPCVFAGFDRNGLPMGKPHPAAWIQIAAVSQTQTKNTMRVFPGMFSPEAVDEYGIDIGLTVIHTRRGGLIEAVTSSPLSLQGGRATLVILNETHHWLANNSGVEMAAIVKGNAAKSRADQQARTMEITNAHQPGEGSVAEESYLPVMEALLAGEGLAGVYYDSLEATTLRLPDGSPVPIKDLSDEDIVESLKIGRGDSVWLDVEGLLATIRDPTTKDSFGRRYYLNQVEAAEETWVEPAAWAACRVENDRLEPGSRICVGFDGSLRDDSTVLVACRLSDGHLFRLASWERPAGPMGNSWSVDRRAVNAAVRDAFDRFSVVYGYFDPPHWQDYIDNEWSPDLGEDRVIEFWTNRPAAMGKALERLHTAILAREVGHDGDELLTRHVGNAVAVQRGGSVQVNKRRHGDKIDGLVSATLAYEARAQAIADGLLDEPSTGGWMVIL